MIYKNGKLIDGIYYGKTPINTVYFGKKLVWERNTIKSCYASGYWIDEMPWTEEDFWSDNNK